jgi:hypothetical protein
VLGLTQSLTSFAQITGPVIAGILIQHRQLTVWALLAGCVAAVGWMVAAPEPVAVTQGT